MWVDGIPFYTAITAFSFYLYSLTFQKHFEEKMQEEIEVNLQIAWKIFLPSMFQAT